MDERRIVQALRDGPPDEPAYEPGNLRGAATSDDPTGAAAFHDRLGEPGVRLHPGSGGRREASRRLGWVVPLAAAVVITIVGLAALRMDLGPAATQSAGPNDMLGRITADGVVHIAVSNEQPQVQTEGNAYAGFDVDVANAVAAWVATRPDLQFASPDDILRGDGDWELAFPSRTLPDKPSGARAGPRYYVWPSWLVVEAGSTLNSIEALNGAAICIADGSGADWLSGRAAPDTAYVTTAPLTVTVVPRASDEDCLAALAAGEAQAAVTATLLDVDFASRGMRGITGSPVLRRQQALLIRDTSAFGDPTAFQAAVTAAITNLRTSGQLSELSRRAFGGLDLTGDLP